MSRDSSVSTVSGYWLDDRAIDVRSPVEARGFFLISVSRPALRPTQLPLQWVSGILSPGVKLRLGVTLTTHLHRQWVWSIHLSSASICVFWHCFLSCDHITEVFDRTGLSAWVHKVYIPQSSLFSLRIQFVTPLTEMLAHLWALFVSYLIPWLVARGVRISIVKWSDIKFMHTHTVWYNHQPL
jgi:hypothetical protein